VLAGRAAQAKGRPLGIYDEHAPAGAGVPADAGTVTLLGWPTPLVATTTRSRKRPRRSISAVTPERWRAAR
jgi:hypothetical protein